MRELNLESGRILSVFGPKQITLNTPHANIGIRGTAAYLESEPASTYVCVCYGHALMTPKAAPAMSEDSTTVTTKPRATSTPAPPPPPCRPWG